MATHDDDPFPIDGMLTAEELEFLAHEPALRRMCGMTPGQRVLGVKAMGKGENWKKRFINYCCRAEEKAYDAGAFKRALGACTLGLRILPQQRDFDTARAHLLCNSANILRSLRQHEAAQKQEEQAWILLQQPHLAANPALDIKRARLLIKSAGTRRDLGQYEAAQKQVEQAWDLLHQPHLLKDPALDAERARLLSISAAIRCDLGLYEAAQKQEEQAWDLLHQPHLLKDPALDANLLMNSAATRFALGQYEAAQKQQEQAWNLLQQPHLAANPVLDIDRACLLINSIATQCALGQHEAARELEERAWDLLQQPHLLKDLALDIDRAHLLMNSAGIRFYLGQYEAAQKQQEQAWNLLQQPHLAAKPVLDIDRACLLINSIATQCALGQHKAAQKQVEQAWDLLQQPHLLKNPALDIRRAGLLMNSAGIRFYLGQYEAAQKQQEQAWNLLQQPHLAANPVLDIDRARLLINSIATQCALGQHEAAQKQVEQAWDLLQQPHLLKNPALDIDRARLLMNSAGIQKALGQHEEGLADLRRAIQQLLDTPTKITGDWVKVTAGVAWLLAEEAAAGRCPNGPELLAPLSAAFIEVMDLQPESFLALARSSFIRFHRLYLDLCLRQGRYDLLPEVLRAVQGRKMAALMLEELDQTPTSDPTIKAFRDLRRKLRQMALGLQVLSGDLDGPGGMKGPHSGGFTRMLLGEPAISADEATRRVREYEALLPTYRRLRLELERTGRLPDPKRGKSLAELQQTLHPGQALALLVHLPVDADAESPAPAITAALLVTATATELVDLENLPQVAYEGQRYSDACRGRGRRQTLTRRAPTAASALADDQAAPSLDDLRRQINESFWEPLRPHLDGITQLTLLPHGDLLHALPYELAAPDTLHLRFYPGLVFYDQALTARGTPLPQPDPNAPLGLRVHPAAETDQPVYLVQAEAELVREVWEKTGATVTNPADLTQASPAWSVFHAASHGDLDPQQPGSAYLLLGPQEHLNLSGVLASPQHPPLVFLSACVVGRLQEDLDGDPLGLVSGFFLKGTRYVVAPLIPVPDHYMPLLGVLFHQAWQSGLDPEAALAEAKRRLREADWYEDTADLARAAYAPVLKQRYEQEGEHLVNELVQADLTDFCDPKAVAEAIQKNDFLIFVRGFGDVE